MPSKKAVVLLSGGVDSSTAMAVANREGYEIHALSFRYGQRHGREIEAAKRVAAIFEVGNHLIIDFDLRVVGGSALTDQIDVPKGREPEEISRGIPVTYVPARNTIFLSFALSLAEKIESPGRIHPSLRKHGKFSYQVRGGGQDEGKSSHSPYSNDEGRYH
jgi:7-cyano-7-deazaguanine synthase